MKAAVYKRFGPPEVITIEDVPKPTPADNEVLVKIRATTVSTADWRLRSLDVPFGFKTIMRLVFGVFRPRQPILGTELSGDIEAVGNNVSKFKVGDAVFAHPGASLGSHAQFRTMPEDAPIAVKPENLSYEQAAAVSFGGTAALDFLKAKANIQPGEKVLIIGASGAVGSAAVQLARHFGAHVTGIASTPNMDLLTSLGAHNVIDYTKEDFTKNGETYDIIMDTVGATSFSKCKASLKENGRLLLIVAGLPDMLNIPWAALASSKKIIAGSAAEDPNDLLALKELAETGAFTPLIDRRFPLDQITKAHALVDTGHKKGSVVITIDHND